MSDERNPFAEAHVEVLKENFLKQNPFAAQAKKIYAGLPTHVRQDPVYYALMAVAFELYARAEGE